MLFWRVYVGIEFGGSIDKYQKFCVHSFSSEIYPKEIIIDMHKTCYK